MTVAKMASTQKKFDAAVTLIKSLPKDGPFQPSYGMMKTFYGLFKQATIGPCNEPKPAFWEAVRRTKWEAWSGLGDMSKETAMKTYVDEMLKIVVGDLTTAVRYGTPETVMMGNANAKDLPHLMQIVETMPHTEEAGNFMKVMGPFLEAVQDQPPKKSKAGKMTNGNVPHENGDDRLSEDSGRGEDDPEVSSQAVSSSAQVMTVDVSALSNKAGKPLGPSGDTSDESHPILVDVNGTHDGSNGIDDNGDTPDEGGGTPDDSGGVHDDSNSTHEGSRSESEESESESEEFCDSMDQPVLDKLPPLVTPAQRLISNGPILTSTPQRQEITTQAQVHEESMQQNTTRPFLESVPSDVAGASRRGGGEVAPGSQGQGGKGQQRDGGGQEPPGGRKRGSSRGSSEPDGRGSGSQGGASGGQGPGRRDMPGKTDVSEQIAVALERLQRDMNSVLIRLNTLEALALSREQADRESDYQRSPEGGSGVRRSSPWWMFRPLPKTSVFFLLVWPLIVHWLLKFIARRRRRHQRF